MSSWWVKAIIIAVISGIVERTLNRLFNINLWAWVSKRRRTLRKNRVSKESEKAIGEFESLVKRTKEIRFKDNKELDKIEKKAEMLIRRVFGDDSHYINKLNNIYFSPSVIAITNEEFASDLELMSGNYSYRKRTSSGSNELMCWEDGKEKLINLLETMIEDLNF